ncbi:hypothetical protein [Actinacidiphila bryophytorum]|uniref:hypothetical protein n=1 Tax=Actinacidiphila bryophytorum TaxID=1436133 RepID=UPI002176B224|nr:hypothetical protein [Actinacidiphila bryophytorum]UWE10860.1 hypothetical protein NYE86_20525 [Actinacidiphila bryophytorum]
MSWQESHLSRRSTLGLIGAGAAATVLGAEGTASAEPAAPPRRRARRTAPAPPAAA